MKHDDKRKSSGVLMPNIFFALEVTIALLIVNMAFQFDLTPGFTYLILIVFCISIVYFIIQRRRVLDRQK